MDQDGENLVTTLRKTAPHDQVRCLENHRHKLKGHGDETDLGGADEQKDANRSPETFALSSGRRLVRIEEGFRRGFGVDTPPRIEAPGIVERTHEAKKQPHASKVRLRTSSRPPSPAAAKPNTRSQEQPSSPARGRG